MHCNYDQYNFLNTEASWMTISVENNNVIYSLPFKHITK